MFANFPLSGQLRSLGKGDLSAGQVWRHACTGLKAAFEMTYCRVNVRGDIKVMRATTAISDSTLRPDWDLHEKLVREMDDAPLRYKLSFYARARDSANDDLLVEEETESDPR
jgi:hypothetical protein